MLPGLLLCAEAGSPQCVGLEGTDVSWAALDKTGSGAAGPSKAVPEQQGPDAGKRGSEQGRSTLTACLPGTRCGMMAEAPVEED